MKAVGAKIALSYLRRNGGLFGITQQKPLRAGKGSYYGGIVNLCCCLENKILRILLVKYCVNLDIFPTILSVANIPYKLKLDGIYFRF